MPKSEFDLEDPLELNGVALATVEDTSAEMAACFVEEFLRLGYGPDAVLALFRNPHYLGPHLVLRNKGEPFVREIIHHTFAQWGRPFAWGSQAETPMSHPPQPHAASPGAPPL